LAELWAQDALFVSEASRREGHAGIEAEALATAKDFVFRSTNRTAGHHDVVRMSWEMRRVTGGDVAASGLAVLVLSDDGRIRRDYQLA
jgi:hypothetical protein